ncbi:rhomboid family intramembrane serine protease [Kitasatospora herbaricolor]|uniref:rhomboid family intramembrane serine protease n=1 Tax=Kitasatospora herbaricolor TaxID=68217 RepID=UPI00174873D9|nr:rhomboid family intramembrane serine protease [Kitasatospora herbaricolor]MDQ0309659.1 membrane associated rhomboid family serine protease [Kitasatospora herbaricolor]GGV00414.1 rhomboid family intramembrane serine protease [Kitasatospora herbaricolor]
MLPDEPQKPADRPQQPAGRDDRPAGGPPPAERPGPPAGGSASPGAAHPPLPGCYRHPERETGIGCSRCGRPICPRCMTDASVGFHCPECVSGGDRTARRATTRFGGQPVRDGALVTKILIGINLLVFLLAAYVYKPWLANDLSLLSVSPRYDGWPHGVAEGPGQWYRLLTATFLHIEIWHIATNMLALWWMGPMLEQALGRIRYLALYLVSGLAGSALAYLIAGDYMNSLGASGAIFGLFGATVVLFLRTRTPLGPVIALLVFNLVITFSVSGIDWRAHVGGLLAGAAMGFGLMYAPRERRNLVQGAAVVLMLGVVVGAVVLQTALLNG